MRRIQLAGCIIKDEQGRVLLLHRNTSKLRQWEIPGGKLESGERPAEAAARELREEMGVEVEVRRRLGTQSFVQDGCTMVYTWFLARIRSGTPQALETHTHDEFRYLPIADLKKMTNELSPNTRNFVDEIAGGRIKL
jgi:8-oxo-dGTP diphosphatase